MLLHHNVVTPFSLLSLHAYTPFSLTVGEKHVTFNSVYHFWTEYLRSEFGDVADIHVKWIDHYMSRVLKQILYTFMLSTAQRLDQHPSLIDMVNKEKYALSREDETEETKGYYDFFEENIIPFYDHIRNTTYAVSSENPATTILKRDHPLHPFSETTAYPLTFQGHSSVSPYHLTLVRTITELLDAPAASDDYPWWDMSEEDLKAYLKYFLRLHMEFFAASAMTRAVSAKFKNYRELNTLLMFTGKSPLIWNDPNDYVLGIGIEGEASGNIAGKVLERERDSLVRSQCCFSPQETTVRQQLHHSFFFRDYAERQAEYFKVTSSLLLDTATWEDLNVMFQCGKPLEGARRLVRSEDVKWLRKVTKLTGDDPVLSLVEGNLSQLLNFDMVFIMAKTILLHLMWSATGAPDAMRSRAVERLNGAFDFYVAKGLMKPDVSRQRWLDDHLAQSTSIRVYGGV